MENINPKLNKGNLDIPPFVSQKPQGIWIAFGLSWENNFSSPKLSMDTLHKENS